MRRSSSGFGLATALAGILMVAAGRPASAGYTITDLGTLGGGYSYARSINASGRVVGYSQLASTADHAFFFKDDALADLSVGTGVYSSATCINASGAVVGSATLLGDQAEYAFVFSDGKTRGLGTLGGTGSASN